MSGGNRKSETGRQDHCDRRAEGDREQERFRPTKLSGTRPLPENFFSNAWARKIDAIEPANVVIVAQVIAVR